MSLMSDEERTRHYSQFDGEEGEIFLKIRECAGSLTHGGIVGVWETLVDPLPHEHPAVVSKGALYDLVVVFLQLLSGL